MSNPQTPLSPPDRAVLHPLEAYVGAMDTADAPTRQGAVSRLTDGEFEQDEAHWRIEQLLLKGYLHEVGGVLRILPRRQPRSLHRYRSAPSDTPRRSVPPLRTYRHGNGEHVVPS